MKRNPYIKGSKGMSVTEWDRTYKALACAVITTAIKDACRVEVEKRPSRYQSPGESCVVGKDRSTANSFMFGDGASFRFWCGMAGIDSVKARQRLRGYMRRPALLRQRMSKWARGPKVGLEGFMDE